jgi:hypothetical protein
MQATTLEVTLIFTHATSLHHHIKHTQNRRTHALTDFITFARIYKPTLSHNKFNHGPSIMSTHKCPVPETLSRTHGGMNVRNDEEKHGQSLANTLI